MVDELYDEHEGSMAASFEPSETLPPKFFTGVVETRTSFAKPTQFGAPSNDWRSRQRATLQTNEMRPELDSPPPPAPMPTASGPTRPANAMTPTARWRGRQRGQVAPTPVVEAPVAPSADANAAWVAQWKAKHSATASTPVAAPTVVEPVSTSTAIARSLNLIWVGPHDIPSIPIDSWINKHPAWRVTLWRDHTKGWKNADVIERLAKKEWNGVADVMRLEILEREGGIVVDADSICLRALDEGPEDFLANDKAFAFYENEIARPGIIACGIMGAPPGSAFFTECVRRVADIDTSKPAWTTVGPMMITNLAKEMPSEVRVYSAKWAHPTHFSGTSAPGALECRPYANQLWGSTKSYNAIRPFPCSCALCRQGNCLMPSWG
jgi:Glycosyltransferase sugar-binding region containing DXD motif